MTGYDFNRYDIVSLTSDHADVRAGTQGQILGCYRRRETSWVVAFGDRIVEDLHDDELAFVRSESRLHESRQHKPCRVVVPHLA